MKQLKLLVCSILIISLLFCCSCGLIFSEKYECNVENVKSVQLVLLKENLIEENRNIDYTVLAELEDYSKFIERLNGIKQSKVWGTPNPVEPGMIAISIEYSNGESDLIRHDSQVFHRAGQNNCGYYFFDEEQFQDLLSDYFDNDIVEEFMSYYKLKMEKTEDGSVS